MTAHHQAVEQLLNDPVENPVNKDGMSYVEWSATYYFTARQIRSALKRTDDPRLTADRKAALERALQQRLNGVRAASCSR
jgi:hypothetical protein